MTRQFFPSSSSSSSSSFFLVYPSYPVANRFRPLIPAAYRRSTLEASPASKLTLPFTPQIDSENPGNDLNEFLEYLASVSLQVLPRPMSPDLAKASVRRVPEPANLSAAMTTAS